MHRQLLRTLALSSSIALLGATPMPHYMVTKTIPGGDGGWDYARVDPASRTLYVAHGENVMSVSLKDDAVTSFGAISHAHAVVPIPQQHILLVTSGQDNTVRLFDTRSERELASLSVGEDPDAALFDEGSGRAAVMNAKAGSVSVIDVARRQVISTIALKPGLEFGVVSRANTLFVNNEDENEIETADLGSGRVGPAIAMPGCEEPSGLGYDARTGQLVSACANGKAAVVDAKTRHLVKLIDIGQGPDAVIVDQARRIAFIPCGKSGTMSVLALDARGGASVITTVPTEQGARTGALDPVSGALYLPTARFGPAVPPATRPKAIDGSFHVLVVERR